MKIFTWILIIILAISSAVISILSIHRRENFGKTNNLALVIADKTDYSKVKARLEKTNLFKIKRSPPQYPKKKEAAKARVLKGECGCTRAHRKAWAKAAKQSGPTCIFEKDALLAKNSSKEIKKVIDAVSNGYDFGFLGYGPSKQKALGTHGYCLTPQTAEYLLNKTTDNCKKQKKPVDRITASLIKDRKVTFAKDYPKPKYAARALFRPVNNHGVVFQDVRSKSEIKLLKINQISDLVDFGFFYRNVK